MQELTRSLPTHRGMRDDSLVVKIMRVRADGGYCEETQQTEGLVLDDCLLVVWTINGPRRTQSA